MELNEIEKRMLYQTFAAVKGLCREQGDMAEVVAGYLVERNEHKK